jgi:hypothetical protein
VSLIPGIASQKTELIDGVKVDTLDELTVGNGVMRKGRTSGTAVAAGFVGESFGSVHAGTGGFSTTTWSTTTVGGTATKVISRTVNKGSYLVWVGMSCLNNTANTGMSGYLTIGGGQVTASHYGTCIGGTSVAELQICVPITITADSTEVAGWALAGGTIVSSSHEMTIVRIA